MNSDSLASFSTSSTISIFSSLSTSLASCPDHLPNLEACACLTFQILVGYRGTMRRRQKNPHLCLLLNSGLWHRCSLHKSGSPRCSCLFLYKDWYSPVSSSSTYCPQSRDSSSYIKSMMSLHCSWMPCPTRFSSLTICTTGSPCFASISVPTPTANSSFISAATSATSVPSSVVASTKFSTSFTVLASICWPSESTLALYMGSLHSKLASSQLNNGCVLQGFQCNDYTPVDPKLHSSCRVPHIPT